MFWGFLFGCLWSPTPAPLPLPPTPHLKQISVTAFNACGINHRQEVVCWGDDLFGVPSPPSGTFQQVSISISAACALDTDGYPHCWGPVAGSPPTPPLVSLHTGQRYGCGITQDQQLHCWSLLPNSAPDGIVQEIMDHADPITSLSVSLDATCVLDTVGYAHCRDLTVDTDHPSSFPFPEGPYAQIVIGYSGGCGIVAVDRSLRCWGENASYQQVPSGHFQAVEVGQGVMYALDQSGQIHQWGVDHEDTPSGTWAQIAAGASSACALDTKGHVTCWGSLSGPLGSPPPEIYRVSPR